MALLFSPLRIRDIETRNRIVVSPMCQYSAPASGNVGSPTDWHLVHLGARAIGGAGIVMVEATAVEPRGRISPGDLGIWADRHVDEYARITRFVAAQGAQPAIQLAHAGRKGSTQVPWQGSGALAEGGWEVVAPSALAFDKNYPTPRALGVSEIAGVVMAFADAARRALDAGFTIVEIHSAHGYLLHEFLSPLSNHRTDQYGGSLENRTRLVREVATAVRAVWPERLPLFLRLSATDWKEGGWDLDSSVWLAGELKKIGVDVVDCSSGGNVAHVTIPLRPGYQADFASEIRRRAGVMTAAVGLLTEPQQTEELLQQGTADLIFLARALLRDPHWPLRAAHLLGVPVPWPKPYERAKPADLFWQGQPLSDAKWLKRPHSKSSLTVD